MEYGLRAKEKFQSEMFRGRNWLRARGIEVSRRNDASLLSLHLAELFDRHHVDVVLDIGARNGETGQFLRWNGYRGRIASFEPVSTTFAVLEKRAADDPLWDTWNFALGAREESAEINVTEKSCFSSFRSPSPYALDRFGSEVEVHRAETVHIQTLDGIWDNIVRDEQSVFLKLDTQGWDLEVLRGATKHLPEVVGLQTEMSMTAVYNNTPTFNDSLSELRELGFAPTGFFPVVSEPDGRLIELDCVAVRIP